MEENVIHSKINRLAIKQEKQVLDVAKALNNKLDQIMEHEEIKNAQNNMKKAGDQMTRVDTAVKAYFNIKKKIMEMEMDVKNAIL